MCSGCGDEVGTDYVITTVCPPEITLVHQVDGTCAQVQATATELALVAAHLGECSVADLFGRTFAGPDDFQAAFDGVVSRARASSAAPLDDVTLILPPGRRMEIYFWGKDLGSERLHRLLRETLLNASATSGVRVCTRSGWLVYTNVSRECPAYRDIDVHERDGTTIRLRVRAVAPQTFWLDGISVSRPEPGGLGFLTR